MNVTLPTDEPTETENRGRSQKSRWLLGKNAKGDDVMAELSTLHHGAPSYTFRSVLNRVTVNRGPNFTSHGFWLMDGVTVEDIPAKRFSARGLVAAHDSAVAALRLAMNDERVDAKFAPVSAQDNEF